MSNQHWLERSRASVWHPCTQMKRHETLPIIPVREASGIWLTDFEGNRYIDGVSSWWVNLFGHGEPRIKAAIRDQLDSLEHVILAGFTHAPVVELSERLGALTGLGHAFYGSDGASATEIALKMSFHYWKNLGKPEKNRYISLENSYHGETAGALSVTDVPLFSATYAPLLRNAIRVPSPDSRKAAQGENADDVALAAAAALENVLAKQSAHIAAIILEPLVQGAAGMAMYSPLYLETVRQLADRYDVHLIADEIAVGFGRTGTLFACEQAGIRPDFLCLSKGITGGFLPLSCVLTRDGIYDAFYDEDVTRGFLHSHSYTGNALACRAALAVLDIFRDDDILAANRERANQFTHYLEPVRQRRDIHHFRHTGMIWAFDVDTPHPGFGQAFFQAMLAQGCLVRPIGNTVYFMPPYCIDDAHMAQLAEATCKSLDALADDPGRIGAGLALP
ncbi:adenosylmethionine--8-amino-7-oxononanoate transaminase [Paludibacterium paludis]|uniref:Adenosylmethionine-8-amino-7-oxononanoate aminotransferase n=1 Tax=Paludibacterium paludis TaxID=1225769 RepID=A0A918U867_9NEIS|nr:adenosylmethionine--8-amino-7-oxononanoate transaminase [Paludibacterium paludis]GGY10093.1 adenosylmethionine--8-amino-7-oxononanoate aminotransferase BioA [Paludibacterium paludis]